jgi:hypothetical protein
MDCARAAEVIGQFRCGDLQSSDQVVQTAVDHVYNCECDSCSAIKPSLKGEITRVSIGQV